MTIRTYKPTSAGRRQMSFNDNSDITTSDPQKSLLKGAARKGGRNSYGRITAKRRGGGHRRMLRLVDLRREKFGVPGIVATIEHDPNRSARIALVHYGDGEKRYIVAPEGIKVGDKIVASRTADINVGNALPLAQIPLGTMIHNVELHPNGGAKMVRSAGTMAQILSKEGRYAHVRLPSGEVRKVSLDCHAVIGQVSNIEHNNVRIGKAGRTRWMGWRPRVRAIAMNPVDHPMGGGEGRTKGGRHPCSEKGTPCKGYKTRKNKSTTKFIVKKRGKK